MYPAVQHLNAWRRQTNQDRHCIAVARYAHGLRLARCVADRPFKLVSCASALPQTLRLEAIHGPASALASTSPGEDVSACLASPFSSGPHLQNSHIDRPQTTALRGNRAVRCRVQRRRAASGNGRVPEWRRWKAGGALQAQADNVAASQTALATWRNAPGCLMRAAFRRASACRRPALWRSLVRRRSAGLTARIGGVAKDTHSDLTSLKRAVSLRAVEVAGIDSPWARLA